MRLCQPFTISSLFRLLAPNLAQHRADEFAAIHAALLAVPGHLLPRPEELTPEKHSEFTKMFGPPQYHPAYNHVPDYPEITVLENDRERPSLIEKWHTDMTFRESPPLGSILHGKIIPDQGRGDTEFLSMAAAFECTRS